MLKYTRQLTLFGLIIFSPTILYAEIVNSHIIEFCEFGFGPQTSETLKIDIEQRVAIGSDTRTTLMPLIEGEVIGFESPFPLAVPLEGTSVSEWESDHYRFSFSRPYNGNHDWIEITAIPLEIAENFSTSRVLFSKSEGVIVIRITRSFDGFKYDYSMYRCDVTPFFPHELLPN